MLLRWAKLNNGYTRKDKISWDAYNECNDVKTQVEAYREIHGHYPEYLLVDKIYLTRDNRNWLKENGIKIADKPLGRLKKESACQEKKGKS